MKEQSQNKTTSDFFDTEVSKTKSNAIEIPQISLPKAGGALRAIDEKFQVNPANGTASFSISLPITPYRNGFSHALSLSYNSGGGNGIFGLGWSFDIPCIQRKTNRHLPATGMPKKKRTLEELCAFDYETKDFHHMDRRK